MKSLRLFLLLLLGSTGISPAATIHVSGQIKGVTPEPNPTNTLDFYFITVLDASPISGTFITSSLPSPSGTRLDLAIYEPPDQFGDMYLTEGIIGVVSKTFTLNPGLYVMATRPGNSDFDGAGGPVPLAGGNSAFIYWNYDITLTGNVRLDEKWIGQPNGTFIKTVVPEPSANLLVSCAATALVVRRNRLRPSSSGIFRRMLAAAS